MINHSWIRLVLLAPMCLWGCDRPLDLDTSKPTEANPRRGVHDSLLQEGKAAYTSYCAGCHGEQGDGNGPAAGFLRPRPRNFQRASFKFSSTRFGSLPTDEDLRRTIRNGLRGSSMPDWPLLSEQTIEGLIAYIKTFSPRWTQQPPAPAIPFVSDPYRNVADKHEAIERGKQIYHGFANCWSCHPAFEPEAKINEYIAAMEGTPRTGFRPNLDQSEVKVSAEGEFVYPTDFRRDFVRSGMTVDDLYRSIAAGITGTAMPTWVDSMEVKAAHGGMLVQTQDLWAMAYYIHHLMQQRPALLDEQRVSVRDRKQNLYFHGEIPPPEVEQIAPSTGEDFEEDQ